MRGRRKRIVAGAFVALTASCGYVAANDAPHGGATSTPTRVAGEAQRPFAEGARYLSLTGGYVRSETKGEIYPAQVNVSWYFADDLAVQLGGTIGYADAKRGDNGVLGGPEVGVRWHFAQGERWSTFLDGTAGLIFQEESLTPDSLRYNFDVQLGVGATHRLSGQTLLQGGVRWYHLSNARVQGRDENLGYDGPLIYLGLMTSF